MSAMHSPLNSPVHSVYRAGKTSLNRRQTLTRLGLLFMVGPLGIAAQHLEWQQWIPLQRPAIGEQKSAALADSARELQRCECPQACATSAPACACAPTPCR
jgi:transmembrane sensor